MRAGSPARRAVAACTSCARRPTRSRSGWARSRAENPALTARDVGATRQPRRLAFGRGPLPEGSELELVERAARGRAARGSGAEGVQSLLLEGGPTLAGSFLRDGLIDKVVLFVAPKVIGGDDAPPLFAGPGAPTLAEAIGLDQLEVGRSGEDVVLTAYIHESDHGARRVRAHAPPTGERAPQHERYRDPAARISADLQQLRAESCATLEPVRPSESPTTLRS